jgi:hypothetical protein
MDCQVKPGNERTRARGVATLVAMSDGMGFPLGARASRPHSSAQLTLASL